MARISKRWWGRLLPIALLAAIGGWYFWTAPKEVVLEYSLRDVGEELDELTVELHRVDEAGGSGGVKGDADRRATFFYSAAAPAPALQQHRVRLLKGAWRLRLQLSYRDGKKGVAERSFDVAGELTLTIPLTKAQLLSGADR